MHLLLLSTLLFLPEVFVADSVKKMLDVSIDIKPVYRPLHNPLDSNHLVYNPDGFINDKRIDVLKDENVVTEYKSDSGNDVHEYRYYTFGDKDDKTKPKGFMYQAYSYGHFRKPINGLKENIPTPKEISSFGDEIAAYPYTYKMGNAKENLNKMSSMKQTLANNIDEETSTLSPEMGKKIIITSPFSVQTSDNRLKESKIHPSENSNSDEEKPKLVSSEKHEEPTKPKMKHHAQFDEKANDIGPKSKFIHEKSEAKTFDFPQFKKIFLTEGLNLDAFGKLKNVGNKHENKFLRSNSMQYPLKSDKESIDKNDFHNNKLHKNEDSNSGETPTTTPIPPFPTPLERPNYALNHATPMPPIFEDKELSSSSFKQTLYAFFSRLANLVNQFKRFFWM